MLRRRNRHSKLGEFGEFTAVLENSALVGQLSRKRSRRKVVYPIRPPTRRRTLLFNVERESFRPVIRSCRSSRLLETNHAKPLQVHSGGVPSTQLDTNH